MSTVRIFEIFIYGTLFRSKELIGQKIDARNYFALHGGQVLRVEALILVKHKYAWGWLVKDLR